MVMEYAPNSSPIERVRERNVIGSESSVQRLALSNEGRSTKMIDSHRKMKKKLK